MIQETKTAAQEIADRIKAMPIHKDYKPVPNMPIPLFKDLLIKKTKTGEITTKAGVILGTGRVAENVYEPNEGIIMIHGPMCSEFVRVGLKYKFSYRTDACYMHEGEEYIMADESMLRYVVPSDDFVAHMGYKSEEAVRRGKKIERNKTAEERIAKRDANEEDERKDATKGKIRKLK